MSSAFPLPFKVDNQDICQNHTLKFYTMYACVTAIHHPFICKYKQLFHKQSQNHSIKVHLFQLLHLPIPVNTAVEQKINSMALVCDGGVDK